MASKLFHFLLTLLVLFSLHFALESRILAAASVNPTAFLVPVSKDSQTSLHVIKLQKRTPLKQLQFLVDVNANFLSTNCDEGRLSSTYNPTFCHSTLCARAGVHFCQKCSSQPKPPAGCRDNTCGVMVRNPLTQKNAAAELAEDVLALQSITQRSNPHQQLATVRRFLFACAPSYFLQGPLPGNVQGIAGFNHNPVSLPMQLASHFGFPAKFAFCLPSRNDQTGVIFFGKNSYTIYPGINLAESLTYTPLSVGSQGEYFIPVKSIKINDKELQFNTSLISRTRSFGGTMISTTTPYTILEHSIFNALTRVFTNEILRMGWGIKQVETISPFGACFTNVPDLPKVGLAAPNIHLVMQNRDTIWRIYGVNSLVSTRPGVWCLAFVDGGTKPRASIVIGTRQMEDTLFEFDLARSRFGFGQALELSHFRCSSFKTSA